MCDNAAPYQIMVNPTGGTFYPSYTGTVSPISLTGILSPNSPGLSNGQNNFVYSIMINTCQASNSASFEISHYNPATLTSSLSPQCVTNGTTNLLSIVQSTAGGLWSGPGVVTNTVSAYFTPAGLQTSVYPIVYTTTSSPNPTVCPASSTLLVNVTETVVPSIIQPTPFCTSFAPFSLSVTPSGGVWSNPAVNAASGVVTPSSAVITNSIVNYVVNVGPCVNTGSTTLYISQYNPATITGSVPNLCYNSNNFNLMSIVQFTGNGSWTGPHVNVSSNFFSPSNFSTNPTPDVYTLKYKRSSFPNANLCPDSSFINVSVFTPPVPTIQQGGPYCSKDAAVQMTVSPTIGSWVNSSYLNSSGMLSPSLCSIGSNAVQYVIGTNTCFTQHTKYFNVEAFASASILSKIPDQCNTNAPINLGPFTQSSAGLWSGAGISGTSFNPGNTGAGNFVLTYKTASSPSGLCPDQSTIAVNVFSLAAPMLTQVPDLCNSSKPQQIVVSPVGGLFGGANNTGVNIKGLFNPANGIIGANIINYSITSGPCVAYAQTTINVVKFISADLEKYPKQVYCIDVDGPLNLNGLVLNSGGTWMVNGLAATNMFDPKLVKAGLHVITYSTNSMPSTTLCPDTKTFTIRVGESVNVNVTTNLPNGEGCAPLQVVFYPQTNVGNGSWDFGDGSDPKNNALNTTHIYTTPGTYTAVFSYVSADGCPSKSLAVNPSFVVHENPVANFSAPDEVLVSNPEVQLTNLSTMLNTNKYLWRIDEQQRTDINPVVELDKVGKHQITLLATSVKGCKNEITKTIEVKNDFNVFIPSSFTPNFDGLNDYFLPVFSPYGLDTKSFDMEIFDRWGHSLFRTKDVSKGWDGSLQNKGETLKEEVYIYKIKFKDLDGNLYNKMGHVTLIP
jgi:gliding motility-associated-like protein